MIPEVPPSNNQKLTKNVALVYLNSIKDIFQDKMEKYGEFLEAMKDFKTRRIDTDGVIMRVKNLFKGHRELVLGFKAFLPHGYEIKFPEEKKPVEFDEAFSYVNKIKTRFPDKEHIYKAFLDILNMYTRGNKSIQDVYQEVAVLFQTHLDLLEEFKQFLPNISAPTDLQHLSSIRPVLRHDDRSPLISYVRHPQMERAYISHLENVLSGDRPDLEHEQRSIVNEKDRIKELAILEQDKAEKDFEQDGWDFKLTRKRKASCMFYDSSDLMHQGGESVENFGMHNMPTSLFEGSLWNEENMAKLVSIEEDRDGEKERDDRERDCESDKDREQFDKGSHYVSKDAANHKVLFAPNKEKFNLYKPISELDLSNCQRSTPSYCLLPKNYLMPAASQRAKLGSSVLNDSLVSVASGSEDYFFKHKRKNPYEENMFRCEDDRFELDLLIGPVNSTITQMKELLEKIENGTVNPEFPILIKEHFTILCLRCIEQLYGDHGQDVIEVLRKNASLAIPVILTRLKQKQEEWSKLHAYFNKVWAKVYPKNYHKSLDHRSFYFKQQDTKNLSAKALLSEIKEISEKKRMEDDALLAIAAGNQRPMIPSIEFDYPDPDIFNDLYQLVKYLSHEICTSSDQFDKVMRLWTAFLEPIFGVPLRLQGTESSGKARVFSEVFHPLEVGNTAKIALATSCASTAKNSIPISKHFLRTVKPISKHMPSSMQEKDYSCSKIFYGNDSFYVLFRLHQILYERMLSAKINSAAAETERKRKFSKDLTADLYIKVKTALHSLLDGSADNTKFDDDCRAILGNQYYLLFTLDTLIYKIVKQLQAIVSDDVENKLCQLYFYEKSRQPGRFFDAVYHENARILLHDESLYRFECSSNSTKLSIQLMEYGLEKPEVTAVSIEPNFSSYIFNDYLSNTTERNERIGIFMKRNKRKFEGDDLDGLRVFNGLECKIASLTSKVSYVMDTEDVLFRAAKRRRSSSRALTASQNQSSFLK